jgi:hypothetical protein
MAADFRVVKFPAVQRDFTRRYGSASHGEGGKGSEKGGKLHGRNWIALLSSAYAHAYSV